MLACISGCRGVIGCKVAMGGVLCAKKFALLGLMVGVSAKKFALRAHNGPKSAFYGVLGELFRGSGREGMLLGELCRACEPATASVPGRGPATSCRPHGQALRCLRHPPHRPRWGGLHDTKPSSSVSSACRTPV